MTLTIQCLLVWVQSKLSEDASSAVTCPQCGEKYAIVTRTPPLLRPLRSADKLLRRISPLTTMAGECTLSHPHLLTARRTRDRCVRRRCTLRGSSDARGSWPTRSRPTAQHAPLVLPHMVLSLYHSVGTHVLQLRLPRQVPGDIFLRDTIQLLLPAEPDRRRLAAEPAAHARVRAAAARTVWVVPGPDGAVVRARRDTARAAQGDVQHRGGRIPAAVWHG